MYLGRFIAMSQRRERRVDFECFHHIPNTPKRVSGIGGAFKLAEGQTSTRRVGRIDDAIVPEARGRVIRVACVSYLSRIGALNASSSSLVQLPPFGLDVVAAHRSTARWRPVHHPSR